jgi:tryptophan synthase beta chain
MSEEIKITLTDQEIPTKWYNIQADLPTPMPPPVDKDGNPITPETLEPIFPGNLIEQEVSTQRWIDIPERITEILKIWRPTPLYRARGLEKVLKTPAKLYFKNEGVSPPGSHKPNTAVAQAYYNKEFGIERLTTETGAGQWGSALAFACSQVGLECKVYMVRISYDQKPFRKLMMQVWNADCVPSPSDQTETGKAQLAKDPDTPGSLGIAISEAIEEAVKDEKCRYSLGSVLNHVLMHQTVIGLETKKQFEKIGTYPDVIIGCAGGGSNFAGLSFPFILDKINGKDIKIIATEPTACPTLTRAPYAYDAGDVAMMTPLLPMYSLGHNFIPAPIHAGGLRYHGMAPLVSHLLKHKLIEAEALDQLECYKAAVQFARTEGFIPAPEASHAIAMMIREANKAKEEGKEKTIVINWSGHGLMDLKGYEAYFNNKLSDYRLPEEVLMRSLASMEGLPKPE